MLPVAARLRCRADFLAASRRGRRAARGAVVVHVRPREGDDGQARAGFVVPKTVGGAVTRNLVKRRLRHLVAARLDTWPAGLDVVVRALPPAASRTYAALGDDLDGAFASARKPRRSTGDGHRTGAIRAPKQGEGSADGEKPGRR